MPDYGQSDRLSCAMRTSALSMCENESTDYLPVSGQPSSTFGFAIDTTDHYFCVETVLCGTLTKTPKAGFLTTRLI